MKNKKILIMLVVFILVMVIIIFEPYKEYTNKIELYINDEKIVLSKEDKNTTIDLNSFNSNKKTTIEVKSKGKVNVKVNNKKIWKYIKNNVGTISINEENQIKVDVMFKGNDDYTTYYINTLPSTFVPYEVQANGDIYDGDYYMSTYSVADSTSYVFIMNKSGNIIYYKRVPGFCSQFRKEYSSTGKARYVYTAQDLKDSATMDMNNIYGKMIIMDENYKEIDEVTYITDREDEKTYTIFEYIDDNHYLATSSYKEYVLNVHGYDKIMVTQNNIQEIKDGKIIFEWRSEDHPELYSYIENPNELLTEETNDYIHINRVTIDPKDNNILASFRNISTVLKIDRKTGDIIWSLGGKNDDFGLTQDQKFGYQHSLSFTSDHAIMIFDNGDNRPALGIQNESRVIKIKLDEKSKKVDYYYSYPLQGVYSMAMGSVQVIDEENDIFLVTYGTGIFKTGPVELIDFKNNKKLFTFNLLTNKMMFSSEKE